MHADRKWYYYYYMCTTFCLCITPFIYYKYFTRIRLSFDYSKFCIFIILFTRVLQKITLFIDTNSNLLESNSYFPDKKIK